MTTPKTITSISITITYSDKTTQTATLTQGAFLNIIKDLTLAVTQ